MKHKGIILILLVVLLAGILIGTFMLKKNHQIGEAEVTDGFNGAAVCDGKNVSVGGMGISYSAGVITINKEGTYSLSGNFEGYVFVKAESLANVTLALNDFAVNSDDAPAIYAKGCSKLTIDLPEGTVNRIADNRSEEELEEATISSSTIYCKNDIEVCGNGILNIEGNGDALHSKGSIFIEGGETVINAGDDGIHAEKSITINSGSVKAEKCEEGLEAKEVVIAGGTVFVNASDDGVNATDGNGDLTGEAAEEVYIKITGGENHIVAGGDGLDSNGGIYISGGYTYVEGPVSDGDGIIDFSSEAVITGGTFIGVGSSGMLESFDEEKSEQNVIVNYLDTVASAGELQIVDSSGNVLETVSNTKNVAAYIYSSDKVSASETIGDARGGMRGGMPGGMPGGMQGGDQPGTRGEFPEGGAPGENMPGGDIPDMPSGEIPSGDMPGGEPPQEMGGKAQRK